MPNSASTPKPDHRKEETLTKLTNKITTPGKKFVVLTALAAIAISVVSTPAFAAAKVINLDYANWNPLSLVIKNQGWLEQDAKAYGATVNWVYSASSAAAIQNLNAGALNVGSSAGAAAFVARANGVPLKTVGVFSQPNWAAILVGKNSNITKLADLRHKKIAAQKGTDPYFFLLQALNRAGLDPAKDVTIVNLAHADGKNALVRGDVDAWSGLDPILSQSVKVDGIKPIFQDEFFNSYGVINAREDFINSSPDLLRLVLREYQKARTWIGQNGTQAAQILSDSAKIDPAVAQTVLLTRTRVKVSLVPGEAQKRVIQAIIPILVKDAQVKSQNDADTALGSIYEPIFAQTVYKK